MFVYLSKKIAIPNNTRLNCISWNKDQGYIAVGGDEGLLKVLKLELASGSTTIQNRGGLAAPSNLSMNQTLEGHKGAVQVATWNETQQKLTTSDREGVIMVWMMYKGSWYEEMTNDRKKSIVKGMAWTPDGQKICIVYEDGAVIVGSVDGNRIWGTELKNTSLSGVQWSPDGRLILFSIRNGELHLYDNQGTFVMKLNIQCVSLSAGRSISVVGMVWYSGLLPQNRPALAVCYETGKIQLMRNENDDQPIVVDTQMQATACQWNHDGSILAVCGGKQAAQDKEGNQVMFYTAHGIHLRTLKIPGREITALSWETLSLRIALAVDSFIYFANIRLDYMWCYFSKTIAYLQTDVTNDNESTITFWNTVSDQSFLKKIDNPIAIASAPTSEHCVIAVEIRSTSSQQEFGSVEKVEKEPRYQLLICNSISTTVDAKYTDLRPQFIAINSSYVVIASKDHFMLWQYHTPKGASNLHTLKGRKELRYHIDESPSGAVDILNELDNSGYDAPSQMSATQDPICCVALSEKLLTIGRESGTIQEYTIPRVALCNRHSLTHKAYKITINCNSTRAAIIDSNGMLLTINLLGNETQLINLGRIERKDVWAMCWASDNPLLLAIMEKTRMYVFRGADPEEPISCSGYICNFEDLEITGVLLDEIISGSTVPAKEHLLQLRVKSLRDTEELLAHVGLAEAKQFIEDNPHPRLWRLLAEASLKTPDLETAENAFVRCANYPGIQLIKRLRTIQDENLQKAEVSAFFGDFDEAEKLYIDADRRDLAITLRQRLCDWFRTVQLYRMGPGISDQHMEQAWKEIGKHFENLGSWDSAQEYYEKAHHIEGVMDALYFTEQYNELDDCINKLPEKSHLLGKLGQMMASVGMCNQAVAAFIKLGDVKAAVDTCVTLSNWSQAVELAQKYKMPQISVLLGKHAAHLLHEGRLLEAVELQRKAGRFLDSARLLIKLAEGEAQKKTNYLRTKKLYVLAGLLVEDHLQLQSSLAGGTRDKVLAQLGPEDAIMFEQIWHNAEAFHFMLLTQRQLRSGLMHSAVLTALRLREYENVLDVTQVYSMLALASCADRSFGTCSKAFIKLESLTIIPEPSRLEFEELAVSIFSKHDPIDKPADRTECFTCAAMVSDWSTSCSSCGIHFPACVASGKALTNPTIAWQCTTCHHCAYRLDIVSRKSCPLCHSAIIFKNNEF